MVEPARVAEWLDKHKQWRKTAEIGKAFKADYVVQVDLSDFGLFERNSPSEYRGRARCNVNVVKMDEDKRDGDVIYTGEVTLMFPTRGPVDRNTTSLGDFKKRCLLALGTEIRRLLIWAETDNDVPPGTPE